MKLAKKGPQQWQDQLMVLGAFRYCLGRSSYIVSSCLEWLENTQSQFDKNTLNVMIRDTVEALQDEMAGSPTIDAPGWKYWASIQFAKLNKGSQDWVRHAVAYKNKPWPLMEIPSESHTDNQ